MRTTGRLPRAMLRLVLGTLLAFATPVRTATALEEAPPVPIEVEVIPAHRWLPHAFHDQVLASLPARFPEHELLARRRFGRLGETFYALVCYRARPGDRLVVIDAVAVRDTGAWRLHAESPLPYGQALLEVLERMAVLDSP